MAAGIRPNTALAESAGLHCNRGIVVNDTMQTYDPRIYAVGECVAHRGIAYGLVAPLFEQAKVCANHLANFGIARYTGSVTSTKLKVTGIDLFSAGNFMGGAGTDEIVLNDPRRRVQEAGAEERHPGRRRALRRHGRRRLVFPAGQGRPEHPRDPRPPDVRPEPWSATSATPARTAPPRCPTTPRCAAATASARATSSRRSRKRACSRWTTCASTPRRPAPAAPAPAWSSRSSPRPSAAPTRRRIPRTKPMCGCTDHSHGEVRKAIRDRTCSIPEAMRYWNGRRPNGCATCRPALNYYLISTWPGEAKDDPQSRFINERAHANIQKDGTYSVVPRMWGGLTTPAELRAIADVAEKYQVPTVKVTGGAAHRPARHQEGRPAEGLGRPRRAGMVSGHAYGKSIRTVKTCVGAEHCRFGTQRSMEMGVKLEKMLFGMWTPAQGQARRLRLPAQLRRGRHQGRRRDRRRFRLRDLRRRQRRHQDRGGAVPLQGEDATRRSRNTRRLPPALPRGRLLPRTHLHYVARVGLDHVKAAARCRRASCTAMR
jgi:nitrite reductase (NADH) large subunit